MSREWFIRIFSRTMMGFIVFDGDAGRFYMGKETSPTNCIELSRGFVHVEDTAVTGKNNADDNSPVDNLSQFSTID